jgi:hypothetical protein
MSLLGSGNELHLRLAHAQCRWTQKMEDLDIKGREPVVAQLRTMLYFAIDPFLLFGEVDDRAMAENSPLSWARTGQ